MLTQDKSHKHAKLLQKDGTKLPDNNLTVCTKPVSEQVGSNVHPPGAFSTKYILLSCRPGKNGSQADDDQRHSIPFQNAYIKQEVLEYIKGVGDIAET